MRVCSIYIFSNSLENIILKEKISFAQDIRLLFIAFYIRRGIHF